MRRRVGLPFLDRPLVLVAANLLVAAVYMAVAHWSLRFTFLNGQASPIWPPTGLAIFTLAFFGTRLLPGIWMGATLANRWTGAPWLASSLVGVGNCLEAWTAAVLLARTGFRPGLTRIRDVLALAIPVSLLVPAISATIGLGALWALGVIPGARWPAAWAVWWMGDAMGALIVAPALFTLAEGIRTRVPLRRPWEALLVLAIAAALAWAVFGGRLGSGPFQYSTAYLLFPLVVLVAYRSGPPAAALTTLAVAALAVSSTVAGAGPFARVALHENLVLLATFLSLLSGSGLLVSSAVAEREADAAQLQRQAEVLENSPEAVAMTDLRGRLLFANAQAEALLAPALGPDLQDRHVLAALDREGRRRFREEVAPTLVRLGRWSGELDLQGAPGDLPVPVAHQVFLIRDPASGNSTAAGWIGRDLREQRKTEAALLQTQKLESLGVLAGGVAHDFNNLLAAMQGHLELADLEGLEPQAHRKAMDHLRGLVDRAAGLTQQLLAYAGRGRTEAAPLDLGVLAADLIGLLKVSVGKKAELRIEAPTSLPLVLGDRAQMEQVLLNLVINGAEALESERGSILVRLWSEVLDAAAIEDRFPGQGLKPGPQVLVAVTDDGKGIEPELLERIFDPFFTTKFAGRGLGLSAIRGILRSHGGGLHVSSAPGKGSTFTIALPAAGSTGAAAPGLVSPPSAASGRILLVEDEEALRTVTAELLRRRGYEVAMAVHGQDALDRYASVDGGFDAVLLDVAMPVMDGFETFRRLHALDPDLPVLLCSGNLHPGSLEALRAEGLAGFLAKPYSKAELFRALDQAMAGKDGLRS